MAGENHMNSKSAVRRRGIWADILKERLNQERLKAAGKFLYSCADPQMLSADKYVVLGEEFGEVGRAILNMQGLATDYKGNLGSVRKELVQLAAVAVAWLEFIDSVAVPETWLETDT